MTTLEAHSIRQVSSTIYSLLRPELDAFVGRRIAGALVLIVSSAALLGLSPLWLKAAVDALVASKAADMAVILTFVAGYVLSQWAARSMREASWLAYGKADQRLQKHLSLRLFNHLMSLTPRYHAHRKTGALVQILNNGLLGCRLLFQHAVFSALPGLIELAAMSSILLALEQPFFLAVLILSVLAYAAVFSAGAVRIGRDAREASAAHVQSSAVLTDCMLNYETVKCFNAERDVQRQVDAALGTAEQRWQQFYTHKFCNGLLLAAIFALTLGACMVFAAHFVSRGALTIGEFVLIHVYVLQLIRPIEMIGFAFRDISHGYAFIEKMAELLKQQPEPEAPVSGSRHFSFKGDLLFDHVSLSYDQGKVVLSDVSFAVRAGTTTAVVGVSGSGKSSLVRLLLRFYEPDSGRILLDGVPISALPAYRLREAIAVVPQDVSLFNDTVSYNIGIGGLSWSRHKIEQAARVAELDAFIRNQPHGYETKVGERGIRLSGGERQRVAIARIALKAASIYLLDEATSSLDSKTEKQVLRNLQRIAQGRTTIIITHRLPSIVDADNIVVLEKGSIVGCGTHHALLLNNECYASMWAAQQHETEPEYRGAAN